MADIFKLVSALLVIAIHTDLKLIIQNPFLVSILDFFESMAVPFFFCTTGFMLQREIDASHKIKAEVINRYLCKYIRSYTVLSVMYLPLTLYGEYLQYVKSGNLLKIAVGVIKNYILVGQQFYSWQLWYLLSVIFALVVLKRIASTNQNICVWCTGSFILAYCVNLLSNTKIITHTVGNGRILTGLTYISLGMIVYQKKNLFKKVHSFIIIGILLAVSLIMNISYSTTNIIIFIVMPWILALVMRVSSFNPPCFSKWCRKMSIMVYYLHMYFLFFWHYILQNEKKNVACFIFVSCMSGLFSIVYCIMKDKRIRDVLKEKEYDLPDSE